MGPELPAGRDMMRPLIRLAMLMCVLTAPARAVMLVPSVAPPAGVSPDALRTPESFVDRHRFLRTTTGIVLVNQTIWTYNRFIREGGGDDQFRVGLDTFMHNVEEGFEWDGNDFWTNQFYHPAHGSLHFTVARANGYGYWESSLWALAGSWWWENVGEANPPSLNDWINSTFGGIALGEPLFRLSGAVLDNRARGGERLLREAGGFLIAPGRGLNRVMTGEAFEVHQNPADGIPKRGWADFRFGYRSLRDGGSRSGTSENGFIESDVSYGDPFALSSPFDHFDFDLLCNVNDPHHKIGTIKVAGLVDGRAAGDARGSQHLFGWFQHFDYFDNPSYEFGSGSLGASYVGRYRASGSLEVRTTGHLKGVLLSATRTDYPTPSGRSEDYGPGLGYEVAAALGRVDSTPYVEVGRGAYFVRAIDGNDADHRVAFTTASLRGPGWGPVAAGVEWVLYSAHRDYREFADVAARNQELRAYLSWLVD
jgi:hypothetical protein